MPGSSISISEPNIVLNTAIADILCRFADRLEPAGDFVPELRKLVGETVRRHKRVIFNGNGYGAEWEKEAAKRELSKLSTAPDAFSSFISAESIALFERHGVLTAQEAHSRYEVFVEAYNKTMAIEALTILELARHKVIPAAIAFQNDLAKLAARKKNLMESYPGGLENDLLMKTAILSDSLGGSITRLSGCLEKAGVIRGGLELAKFYRDSVAVEMRALRAAADGLETLTGSGYRQLPTYGEMLYSVE
jgi:glutamine synthetase